LKKILLLLVVLPAFCFAQKDYCKDISNTISTKGFVTYKSPDLKYTAVLKQLSDPIFFALQIHLLSDREHADPSGATVIFEDGTVLKDDSIKVVSAQESSDFYAGNVGSPGMAHTGYYLLQAFFPISKENISVFSAKMIKQVTLSDQQQNVSSKEAAKIMEYIKCMDAVDH